MGALAVILPSLLPIINKFIPDPEKAAAATQEITKTIADSDKAVYESMRDVMVADSQSEGALTRSARPVTVYWSLGVISYLVVVAPAFGLTELTLNAIRGVPSELWMLLTAGVGAYPVLKTIEAAFKAKK